MTLPAAPSLHRLAFLGNHPPRVCGLATFTADLRAAVAGAAPEAECFALGDDGRGRALRLPGRGPAGDPGGGRLAPTGAQPTSWTTPTPTCSACSTSTASSAARTASLLLPLLERARLPVVTTLHTVLERPTAGQRRVMDAIVRRSARLVVMTQRSREILAAVHGVPQDRLAVVPHGIPDAPSSRTRSTTRASWAPRAARCCSPSACSRPARASSTRSAPCRRSRRGGPTLLYVVLGADAPEPAPRREGEAYRASLVRLAERLGVADHVRFLDRFVDLPALTRAIAAADIYLTPYLNEAQSVSGTLAYSFGMGKPVVSTPYWHAAELLADGRGVLVPFADPGGDRRARARACSTIPPGRMPCATAAYRLGRELRLAARRRAVPRHLRRRAPGSRGGQTRHAPGPLRRHPVASGTARSSGSRRAAAPCGWTTCARLLDSDRRSPSTRSTRWWIGPTATAWTTTRAA